MRHFFCRSPANAQEELDTIEAVHKSDKNASLEALSYCIMGCRECMRLYSSLECSLGLQKAVLLCNFTPYKITDWKLLYDCDILDAFISCVAEEEVFCGFKAFFTIIFRNDIPNNRDLDLAGVSFGEDEMNFFLAPERVFGMHPGKRHSKLLTRRLRFLKALKIYLSIPESRISENFIKLLFTLGHSNDEAIQGSGLHDSLILSCASCLMKRKEEWRIQLSNLFRGALKKGTIFPHSAQHIKAIKSLGFIQLFANSLLPSCPESLKQLILNSKGVDAYEFVMSNDKINEIFCDLINFTSLLECVAELVESFIRKIVFIKLQFLRFDTARLCYPGTLPGLSNETAYSVYYFSLFLKDCTISQQNETKGKSAILRALACESSLPSRSYSDADIKTVIDDLLEISNFGYSIGQASKDLLRRCSFGPMAAMGYYKAFSAFHPNAFTFGAGDEQFIQLLAENGEQGILHKLYERTKLERVGADTVGIIKSYLHDKRRNDSTEVDCSGENGLEYSDNAVVFGSSNRLEPAEQTGRAKRRMSAIIIPKSKMAKNELDSPETVNRQFLLEGGESSTANNSKALGELEDSLGSDLSLDIPSYSSSSTVSMVRDASNGSSIEPNSSRCRFSDEEIKNDRKAIGKIGKETVKEAFKEAKKRIANAKRHHTIVVSDSSSDGCVIIPDLGALNDLKHESNQTVHVARPFNNDTPLSSINNTSSLSTKHKQLSSFNNKPLQSKRNKTTEEMKASAIAILNEAQERSAIIIDNSNILRKTVLFKNKEAKEISNGPPIPTNECAKPSFPYSVASPASLFDSLFDLYTEIPAPIAVVPDCFNSAHEYFSIFNNLRIHELRAVIKTNLETAGDYYHCSVQQQQPGGFTMLSSMASLSENDLLFFTGNSDQNEDSQRIALSIGQGQDSKCKTSFFGIAKEISYEKKPLEEMRVRAWVEIEGNPAALERQDNLYFRQVENLTTAFREYHALKSIHTSPLFKYIIKPENLEDRGLNLASAPALPTSRWAAGPTPSKLTNLGVPRVVPAFTSYTENLNESQAAAVKKIGTASQKLFLIQGPPGTGKTRVILSIVASLCADKRKRLLVCAPSNAAIDEIVLRMAAMKEKLPRFVRLGQSASSKVEEYTLNAAACAPGSTGDSKKALLSSIPIVCSTLTSSVSNYTQGLSFDYLIIDEACQATEISALIPFKYNPSKVILVGDPKQLPPTVISKTTALERSLFARLSSTIKPHFLEEQYRMHPLICSLASSLFYNGKLLTAEPLRKAHAAEKASPYKFYPTNFINIFPGSERVDNMRSYYNPREAGIAVQIYKALRAKYKDTIRIQILSPYKAQVSYLLARIHGDSVSTIDAFQGNEADVVILSTVRQTRLGFVCDFRRINVALTRARFGLIILGSSPLLSQNSQWAKIIQKCKGDRKYNEKNICEFIETL